MKALILLLLFLLQIGVPGADLMIVVLSAIFPVLKVELLAEALNAGRRLEVLEARYKRFSSCCGDCAKDLLLSDIELEIAACRSELARLLRTREPNEVEVQLIRIDREALRHYETQRLELLEYSSEQLQELYVEFLADMVVDSRQQFYRLAKAYRSDFRESPSDDARPLVEICKLCQVPILANT